MAKKQEAAEKPRGQKDPKTQNLQLATKIKIKDKSLKITVDNSSIEESQSQVSPSSSTESPNDNGIESCDEHEEIKSYKRISTEKPEKEKKKGKKEEVKNNKRKKQSKTEEVEEGKNESPLYRFPMNRVDRIVRSELSDPRIGPDAVFVINKASEKFLELFCKEAYACAFLDHKKHVSYDHLSSVVAKQKRFDFLSDFVPEKVKAEDALKQILEVDH